MSDDYNEGNESILPIFSLVLRKLAALLLVELAFNNEKA
jgi:hypothetical protein